MKTTNFLNPFIVANKPVASLFLVLCLMINACGTAEQNISEVAKNNDSTEVDNKTLSSADDTLKEVFTGNAEFLVELFKDSPCVRKGVEFVDPSGPITCSEALDGLHNFCESYRSVGNLNYFPTKIDMHGPLENLFIKMKNDNYGLVFHYGYDDQQEEIIYILSKGKLDTSRDQDGEVMYCPFTAGDTPNDQSTYYLKLLSNSTNAYQIIDSNTFGQLKSAYMSDIQIKHGASYVNLDNSHPQMVYHSPGELLNFFEHYKRTTNTYFYIAHGSIHSNGLSRDNHIPCFFFGSNTSFFALDNSSTGPPNTPNWYTRKALDIGRPCPPFGAVTAMCN